MSRLVDKTAIVTGAGSGIGRAIALAYAREGARLALVGRRKERLEAVAEEAGGSPLVIPADISRQSDIDRVMNEVAERLGPLNVLVNNAGLLHIGTAEQITEAQWDATFNVNVRGLWLMSRSALPYMRKAAGGSIVNVASVLGINGARNRASYAPSKAAVILLTKCMAIDHGAEKNTCQCNLSIVCGNRIDCGRIKEITRSRSGAARANRRASHWPTGTAGGYGRPGRVPGQRRVELGDRSGAASGWWLSRGLGVRPIRQLTLESPARLYNRGFGRT